MRNEYSFREGRARPIFDRLRNLVLQLVIFKASPAHLRLSLCPLNLRPLTFARSPAHLRPLTFVDVFFTGLLMPCRVSASARALDIAQLQIGQATGT